eukprot:gnl/Spiro4/571_TR324_c0_g1_i1.p2 gnl/Spiro4/571_TR324_c0_g1~~gnl/Spiro4/571_TR324_c0_g1_i1.p2  ORF type:complete len:100 (+),score=7.24 gnl/Spiro4/571_TR324_c0_g1_i1:395-694(+)
MNTVFQTSSFWRFLLDNAITPATTATTKINIVHLKQLWHLADSGKQKNEERAPERGGGWRPAGQPHSTQGTPTAKRSDVMLHCKWQGTSGMPRQNSVIS